MKIIKQIKSNQSLIFFDLFRPQSILHNSELNRRKAVIKLIHYGHPKKLNPQLLLIAD